MEGSCPYIDSSQKNFPKHIGELSSKLTKPKTNYPIFLKVSLIHVIKIVLVFFVQECFSMLHWINLILCSSHNINSMLIVTSFFCNFEMFDPSNWTRSPHTCSLETYPGRSPFLSNKFFKSSNVEELRFAILYLTILCFSMYLFYFMSIWIWDFISL